MKFVKFRAAHGYDVEAASNESAISFVGEESLTVQSMAEDADINVIVSRFGLTGVMPENPRVPMYEDFSDVKDYRSALHAVMDASERFMELPAKVRARFDNDPQRLLEFISDDANIEEAQKLGLLKEKADGESVGKRSGSGGSESGARGSAAAPGGTPAVGTA